MADDDAPEQGEGDGGEELTARVLDFPSFAGQVGAAEPGVTDAEDPAALRRLLIELCALLQGYCKDSINILPQLLTLGGNRIANPDAIRNRIEQSAHTLENVTQLRASLEAADDELRGR